MGRGSRPGGRPRRGAGQGPGHGAEPHGPVAHHRAAQAPAFPHVPGNDVAGVVESVGDGVTAWSSATRWSINTARGARARRWPGASTPCCTRACSCWASTCWGGHGEFCVVPRPPAAPASPPTAPGPRPPSYPVCLHRRPGASCAGPACRQGDTVLVTGIGGGVATAAMMLAHAPGGHGLRHLPRGGQAAPGHRAGGRRTPSTRRSRTRSPPTSWWTASARPPGTTSLRTLRHGGPDVRVRRHLRAQGRAQPAPAVLQAAGHHRGQLRQPGGVRPRHRPHRRRPARGDRRDPAPVGVPRGRWSGYAPASQLGKIVLEHPE